MQRLNQIVLRMIAMATLACAMAACSSDLSLEGQCSGGDGQAAADSTAGGGLVAGGIALQMTECDVVRRAGPVEKIDIGSDERGERAVTLTYLRGPWPGVYRFTGGRLVSIERAPGPPPAPAKAPKATGKKPAGT